MKRTELRRKTPLRQCSPNRATAITTDIRRRQGPRTGQAVRAAAIKPSAKRLSNGRSTGKPTVAQVVRFEHIARIGCLACLLNGHGAVRPEVHHLTLGGYHGSKRRGHDFTIGLCSWHHQGTSQDFSKADEARFVLGPSYKLHKMAFRARYGTDDQLLETTNKLIALRELALAEASLG